MPSVQGKSSAAADARRQTGAVNYCKGLAAEASVVRMYAADGARLLAQRWRGKAGEIDLIFESGGTVVFVEVKSSRSHDRAAHAVSARQKMRLCQAAQEFLGTRPNGLLTDMRIDVALVDQSGVVTRLENALMD